MCIICVTINNKLVENDGQEFNEFCHDDEPEKICTCFSTKIKKGCFGNDEEFDRKKGLNYYLIP